MRNTSVQHIEPRVKSEGSAETRKRLDIAFAKALDPQVFEEVQLDQRETARFIAEKCRVLRVAARSARLPSLEWLIENTFYEAYQRAQRARTEELLFTSGPDNLQ
jgi:hypothetical protein